MQALNLICLHVTTRLFQPDNRDFSEFILFVYTFWNFIYTFFNLLCTEKIQKHFIIIGDYKMRGKMTVLVADDHPIYIEGLVNLLRSYDFTVLGSAVNGKEAVQLACTLKPDVVLMDANMPVLDGIEATKQIRQTVPATKVVILTGVDDDTLILKAIQAGASGFLLKRLDGISLKRNLLELQAGRNPFSPGLENLLLKKIADDEQQSLHDGTIDTLTDKEQHILQLFSEGMTYKQIAAEINLSEQAVKYHIRKIKEQCSAVTQSDLLEFYHRAYSGR